MPFGTHFSLSCFLRNKHTHTHKGEEKWVLTQRHATNSTQIEYLGTDLFWHTVLRMTQIYIYIITIIYKNNEFNILGFFNSQINWAYGY